MTTMTVETLLLNGEKYKEIAELCVLLETPAVQHIILQLSRLGESTTRGLTTSAFRSYTILKYLRALGDLSLVRREKLHGEVTYKLNHARLDRINKTLESI